MSNDIFDLTSDEIEVISGAGEIDQPTSQESNEYPIIINNPP